MSKNIYQPNKRTPDKETLQKFKDEFYIDQYGDLRNKIDRGSGHGKDQLAGRIDKKIGYVFISINGFQWLIHCIVDYLHHGNWYPDVIDHIDRNPLHNNIQNLERSNIKENNRNKNISCLNKSGITGIRHIRNRFLVVCQYTINQKQYTQQFNYKNTLRKQYSRTIYYWNSYESAWEAAQLFNWLIRKQRGYSVDQLPEIKTVFVCQKNKDSINWNSNDSKDIPGLEHRENRFSYSISYNKSSHYIPYKHKDRKYYQYKNKYYWPSEREAFEIAKLFCYLLRKQLKLPT